MTRDSWKDNPAGPKYIVGVTNFVYRQPLPKLNSRAAMYRCLLQNLRLIPDPVIWSMVVPAMRKWCAAPPKSISSSGAARAGAGGEAGPGQTTLDLETAAKAEEKELQQIRKRTLENAKEILSDVRSAVGVHPHALLRLIRESYGIKSQRRHARMRRITATSPPSELIRKHEEHLGPGRPQIPACLEPLFNGHSLVIAARASASNHEQDEYSARKARAQWQKEVDSINVPLLMPTGTGIETGLEGSGVVETIQAFANVSHAYAKLRTDNYEEEEELQAGTPITEYHTRYPFPRVDHLASFRSLPLVLQKIFPIKLKPTRREPPFPRPPRHETKLNPKTWKHPILLTPRVISRAYGQVWNELEWTRPKGRDPAGPWVSCSYEEVLLWEQRRWDELDEATSAKAAGWSIGTQARVSREPESTSDYWLRWKKGRKETKSAIDRMLKPNLRQQQR